MAQPIHNRTVQVDGVGIFYREAGDPRQPALLLLHGFPSMSLMFRELMTALSDRYHLVAPDYPGFGFSEFPDQEFFEYSFQNLSEYMNKFTDAIGLKRFTIFLHDYGCPIGLRLCIAHPEKIDGIIVMNGNAYKEGNGPQWNETIEYWKHPTAEKKKEVYAFLSEEGVRGQYVNGLSEERQAGISPELWRLEWMLMQRPGNLEMQYVLNCDYLHNFDMFPRFQAFFREHQPPALVIWGKNDPYFNFEEAHCYKRDLPNAEVHIIEDGAHMLLDTHFGEVLSLMENFLANKP